jgi:uncharacterized membrane protein
MQIQAMGPILLIASIALSWNGFLLIFDGSRSARIAARPLPMLASAVCVTSLGLAFSGGPLPVGLLTVAAGLLLGRFVRRADMALALWLSVAFFLAYLRYAMPYLQ